MRRSWVAGLLLALVAASGSPSVASGQVQIVQTGCDTLSGSPPRVRVQFRVENLGDPSIMVIDMSRLQSDTMPPGVCSPPILQCEAPPGWSCFAHDGEALWAVGSDLGASIASGEALDSFAVVMDDLLLCRRDYFVAFSGVFEPFFAWTFGFWCDNPVPARSTTWGELKLLYR